MVKLLDHQVVVVEMLTASDEADIDRISKLVNSIIHWTVISSDLE